MLLCLMLRADSSIRLNLVGNLMGGGGKIPSTFQNNLK